MLLSKNKILRQVFGVLETANFLFLKLLFKNRRNLYLFPGKIFRDYMSLVNDDKWSCRSVFDIFPEINKCRITIEHLPGRNIATPLDELANIAIITKTLQPKLIFEIGTFRGRTALNFALNSPSDCIIYTLDLPAIERESFLSEANASDAEIIKNSASGIDLAGTTESKKVINCTATLLNLNSTHIMGAWT